MESLTRSHIVFEERQRFRQPWLWAVLLSGDAIMVVALLQAVRASAIDRGAGLTAALFGFVLVAAILVFFWKLELITQVWADGLYIRFWPFPGRLIPLAEIQDAEARVYRPILEYGGWGIRWGLHGRAYNVSGNEGVQLVLTNGKRILVGSQSAQELAEAIQRAKPVARR